MLPNEADMTAINFQASILPGNLSMNLICDENSLWAAGCWSWILSPTFWTWLAVYLASSNCVVVLQGFIPPSILDASKRLAVQMTLCVKIWINPLRGPIT